MRFNISVLHQKLLLLPTLSAAFLLFNSALVGQEAAKVTIRPVRSGDNSVTVSGLKSGENYQVWDISSDRKTQTLLQLKKTGTDPTTFYDLTPLPQAGETILVCSEDNCAKAKAANFNQERDEVKALPQLAVQAKIVHTDIQILPVFANDQTIQVTGLTEGAIYELWEVSPPPLNDQHVRLLKALGSKGTTKFTGLAQKPKASDYIYVCAATDCASLHLADNDSGLVAVQSRPDAPNPLIVHPGSDKDVPLIIVGYQQSGTNSSNSAGRFFADLTYQHKISTSGFGDHWSAIGDIRIGSTAQSGSSTVGDFVAGMASTAGKLKMNEIASTAEFLGGFAFRILPWKHDADTQVSLFGVYGASGILNQTELRSTYYATPSPGTQSLTLLEAMDSKELDNQFTTSCTTTSGSTTTINSTCHFLQFVKSQNYYSQEGYFGVRLTHKAFYSATNSKLRDWISVGYGANQAVNTDMTFNAWRFEGFAPFQLPLSSDGSTRGIPIIYLFGYADLARDHSKFPQGNQFIQLDEQTSYISNNSTVTPTSANTYIFHTKASPLEYYSIGVGMDLVSVWNTLFAK